MTSDGNTPTNLLGLDGAWTTSNPSGMALLRPEGTRPRLLRIARSYGEAQILALGESPDWLGPVDVAADGLAAALDIWGPVAVAAVDVPLGHSPITGRRAADNAVSSAYGARKAAVHSPSPERPGAVGVQVHKALELAGLSLLAGTAEAGSVHTSVHGSVHGGVHGGAGTSAGAVTEGSAVIDGGVRGVAAAAAVPPGRWFFETYPHAAIIELMLLSRRLPYKVSKRGSFWPYASTETRWRWAAVQLDVLRSGLEQAIEGVAAAVPSAQELLAVTKKGRGPILKGVEDALDAVVCAWVAHEFTAARTRAFGDADAAIYLPLPRAATKRS